MASIGASLALFRSKMTSDGRLSRTVSTMRSPERSK
jgi:hypothetical protein